MHFPLIKIYTAKKILHIYTAELTTSHWNHACRIIVIFKILLVTIMIRDRGHQNAFARANLKSLQRPNVKFKNTEEEDKERREQTSVATEEKAVT